jgi:hypothetical protein
MRVVGERARPCREAGLRYSAGRAPRGCGRALLRCLLVRVLVGPRTRTRDSAGQQDGLSRDTTRCIRSHLTRLGSAHAESTKTTNNNQQQYSVAAEICERENPIQLKYLPNPVFGCHYGVSLQYVGS